MNGFFNHKSAFTLISDLKYLIY